MANEEPLPPHHHHRARAPKSLRAAVFTVSDTRTVDTDISGRLMEELLQAAGHTVAVRELIPDDPERVRRRLVEITTDKNLDLILLNGGTGISPRDRTFEAVSGLLDCKLPGFGELFRSLSYQQIGAAAMASRAQAGVLGHTVVFCTPGSPDAVRLAMESLILPEAPHLVGELQKKNG